MSNIPERILKIASGICGLDTSSAILFRRVYGTKLGPATDCLLHELVFFVFARFINFGFCKYSLYFYHLFCLSFEGEFSF